MTKAEVLKELDALNELTNSLGRASIVVVRAWVKSQNEVELVAELPKIDAPEAAVKSPRLPVKRAVKKAPKRRNSK